MSFGDSGSKGGAGRNLKGYLRITNGITMDSGSAAFVMPTRWLPMFALQKSEAQARGQKYAGATGKVLANEGEEVVDFVAKTLAPRQLTFQFADVNTMLACIAGITDADDAALCLASGGFVVQLNVAVKELIQKMLEASETVTEFDRKETVYVMDAYVKVPEGSKLEAKVKELTKNISGFPRQGK